MAKLGYFRHYYFFFFFFVYLNFTARQGNFTHFEPNPSLSRAKTEIPEKKHLTTNKKILACLERGSNPQQ